MFQNGLFFDLERRWLQLKIRCKQSACPYNQQDRRPGDGAPGFTTRPRRKSEVGAIAAKSTLQTGVAASGRGQALGLGVVTASGAVYCAGAAAANTSWVG